MKAQTDPGQATTKKVLSLGGTGYACPLVTTREPIRKPRKRILKSFPKTFSVSRCADTDRQTHAHGRARRPREPTQQHFGETKQQPAPRTGIKQGRAGEEPAESRPARTPTPGGTRARPAGRRHLLRGPRAGAAPQPRTPRRARSSPLLARTPPRPEKPPPPLPAGLPPPPAPL